MIVYLVGGAVRDALLGREVSEHDYVVVNETPQSMLDRGFKQVGKDFPVFLHPKTNEEYALARKERKTQVGHHGFALDIDQVSLEEDLLRRDLTINAIAKSSDGRLVDPYHGQDDLKNKKLRHVSSAFSEDPLRVFRVARFQAMLPEFSIVDETMALMAQICQSPEEIQSLPKERIWKEVEKAAYHPGFYLFWKTLDDCQALDILSLKAPEAFLTGLKNQTGRFALIFGLWHHPNPASFLVLSPPSDIADAIRLIDRERDTIFLAKKAPAEQLLKTLQRLDPFRRPKRVQVLLDSLPDKTIAQFWKELVQTVSELDLSHIIKNSNKSEIASNIANARLDAIKHSLGRK